MQALSTRNVASHKCIKYNHRGRSKSFVARLEEKVIFSFEFINKNIFM